MPRITVNDEETPFTDRDSSLLEHLRETLRHTSIKDGCAPAGHCGACTVLVDGISKPSCAITLGDVGRSSVTTHLGLTQDEQHRYAHAFLTADAAQCGFCIPGIVMRAVSYERRGLARSDDRSIKRMLGPHLCRCTGYVSVVQAIRTAWAAEGHDDDHGETVRRRIGAADMVLGAFKFVGDRFVDGMLYAAPRLADHCRARVLSIDTQAAAACDGVERVFTADDLPGAKHHGIISSDWPLFIAQGSQTAYTGDVLALVVADDVRLARAAAALIDIEYDVLEPVTDMVEASSGDALLAVEGTTSNVLSHTYYERGMPQAEASDDVRLRARFLTQRVEHAFLEPEAVLATPAPDGGLRVFSGGQGAADDQRQIAAILDIPLDRVEVVQNPTGGAFGGKEDLVVQGHAALAAWCLGRPVLYTLDRLTSMRMHTKRHPMQLDLELVAAPDGRVRSLQATILGDAGPYASVSEKVLERAAGHITGAYHFPRVVVSAKAIRTNNPMAGAFRGFGANQAQFAIEGMMDRLADAVGLGPVAIRRLNLLSPGDAFGPGQTMPASATGLSTCLEKAAARYASFSAQGFAVGIAMGIKNTGIGNGVAEVSTTYLRPDADGLIHTHHGWTEMGQGVNTVVQEVVAQLLGIDAAMVRVTAGASGVRALAGQTTASRATVMVVGSTEAACKAALDDGLHPGRVYEGEFTMPATVPADQAGPGRDIHVGFSYSAQVVAVDRATQRVAHVAAVHDVGRAVSPAMCRGQIEGAVHMGLGYALSEEFTSGSDGHPDVLSMRELGLLRPVDMPTVECDLVETPAEGLPWGIRGVGESGLIATAGAVASAWHELTGEWYFRLPLRGGRSNAN
jgi:CO/xanthine dehydrogenase Mo-binding subunit/aerobic-type carbon monoxide dehydrogenase small subunit (CoxS/CutS family)